MGAEPKLPVFAYGTLRHGERNHPLLEGRFDASRVATLDGYALYVQGRVPFAVREPGASLFGEVFWIATDHFDDVLAELDRLERYRSTAGANWYDRVRCTVRFGASRGTRGIAAAGSIQGIDAWVYVAGPETRSSLTEEDRVRSGDWLEVTVR